MFARIVFSATLAGLVAGLFLSAVQRVRVIPLIREAEGYEARAASAAQQSGHPHGDAPAGALAEGRERTLYTVLGNVLTAVGFGLLLTACYALHGRVHWQQGVVWGVAGFMIFNVAPSLGLPPEVPGTEAAPLGARQMWWLATVAFTAAGFTFVVFASGLTRKAIGLLLIILPHLIGAPLPMERGGVAPPELERAFIVATLITNGCFWIALGALSGLFFALFNWEGSPGSRLSSFTQKAKG